MPITLTEVSVAAHLASGTLCLRTGQLTYRVRSNLPIIAEGIAKLYGDSDLSDTEFADFHLEISTIRRWPPPFSQQALINQVGGFRLPAIPTEHAWAYFEWSLNRCVFMRWFHRLILHAGVLERDGRALILVGESGAGKSTLTAALAVSGWRLLSDELTILSTQDGSLTGLARPIALKNESIALIKALDPTARFGPLARGTPKGDIAHMAPPADSVHRVGESAKPTTFAFVRFEPGSALHVKPIKKAHAFMNTAQYAAINYSSLGAAGFTTLAEAIEKASCYELIYSKLDDAIAFFAGDAWTE